MRAGAVQSRCQAWKISSSCWTMYCFTAIVYVCFVGLLIANCCSALLNISVNKWNKLNLKRIRAKRYWPNDNFKIKLQQARGGAKIVFGNNTAGDARTGWLILVRRTEFVLYLLNNWIYYIIYFLNILKLLSKFQLKIKCVKLL